MTVVVPPSNGLKILLVDDQPDVRTSISEMLRRLGHAVDSVGDGPAALVRLGEASYDLMVTDFGMPGMDGLELARRARSAASALPILLLTGWCTADEADPAIVTGVIPKPVTLRVLSGAISSAVHGGVA